MKIYTVTTEYDYEFVGNFSTEEKALEWINAQKVNIYVVDWNYLDKELEEEEKEC
jgi:hypothetical protein